MARGGARANKVGAVNPPRPNRTDMPGKLPIAVAPSTSYGSATASRTAQQAIPMANPSVAPAQATPVAPQSLGSIVQQAGINGLHNPTQRPNEPVTAGLATGAGPGPEALGPLGAPDDYLSQLRAIYLRNPTEPIRQLIQYNENPNGV